MAVIWETVDRLGRLIALDDAAWTHVVLEYEYMANRVQEVRDALTFADEVVHDKTFAHREIHYRDKGSGSRWLRVVVHYRPRNPAGWMGEVVTAHIVSHRSPRELPVWPSRTVN